jgi:hypothetical protein
MQRKRAAPALPPHEAVGSRLAGAGECAIVTGLPRQSECDPLYPAISDAVLMLSSGKAATAEVKSLDLRIAPIAWLEKGLQFFVQYNLKSGKIRIILLYSPNVSATSANARLAAALPQPDFIAAFVAALRSAGASPTALLPFLSSQQAVANAQGSLDAARAKLAAAQSAAALTITALVS